MVKFWYFNFDIFFILVWNRATYVIENVYLFYIIIIIYLFITILLLTRCLSLKDIVFILLVEIFSPYLEVIVSSLFIGICIASSESAVITWSSTNKSVLVFLFLEIFSFFLSPHLSIL